MLPRNFPVSLSSCSDCEVSRAAADSPQEFVAETFAGMVSGKTYSPEIMQRYETYRGPAIKGVMTKS